MRLSSFRDMAPTGKFIVIEGTDGSGSSTQAARLVSYLRSRGIDVLATKEPTAGPCGALIRLILDRRVVGPNQSFHHGQSQHVDNEFDSRALALLFASDRIDHLSSRIVPALSQGRWVVCDRYVLSSLAYQGSETDLEWVASLNRFAHSPDLTVFLDVPVEETQSRMRRSRLTAERYESEEEQHDVRAGYQAAIPLYEERFGSVRRIDAAQDADAVARSIQEFVNDLGGVAT
jgi:dTMP kinase